MLTARAAGQSEQYKKWLVDDKSRADKAGAGEQAAKKTKEQQALKLLDQVITESTTLKVPENRIHILTVALGLVWPRDEKRAREMLKSAAESLAAMIGSLDITDPEISNRAAQLLQTKSELFRAALNYDPAAALDFLRRTRIPGMADQEAQLEADAAWQLVTRDPRAALQIAEQALANGKTGNLPGLVSQLRTKDPVVAEQLASDILNKIQSDDLAANNQLLWLAVDMARTGLQAAAGEAALDEPRGSGVMLIAPSDLRSLINKVVSTSISLGKSSFGYNGEWQAARNAINQIQSMLPQMEKVDPQLSAKIASQIGPSPQSAGAASNPYAVLQDLVQNGSPDDLVKAADSAPAGLRDQYYQQAAWKALNQDDPAKAAEIAGHDMTNPMARQQILDQIEQRSVWRAINDGKIAEARLLIGRLRQREQRAQAFMSLASNVMAQGDHKTAAGLLDEARTSLPETPENYYHVSLLLGIAGSYSKTDPTRGIQIVNRIAGLFGKLIPAAEALQGFEGQTTFIDGEILMGTSSQLSNAMAQFAEQLGNLATSDSAAALSSADSAGRTELRLMADLAIASKLLNEVVENAQTGPIVGRAYNGFVQLSRR
jgi:hypothetical protein